MMAGEKKTVRLRVKRQADPNAAPFWEEFEVPHTPMMNVLACLMEHAKNPVTTDGKKTSPICYDSACLEEVC